MRPRRFGRGEPQSLRSMSPQMMTLQCGHGVSAVENGANLRDVWTIASPSMRPRRFGRGEPRWPGSASVCRRPLQCGHGVSAVENYDTSQQDRGGKILQCGHGVSAVENLVGTPGSSNTDNLQCGHGVSAVENRPHHRRRCVAEPVPSMRPRRFGRGELKELLAAQGWRPILQCGHGVSAVENHPKPAPNYGVERPSMRPRRFGRGELGPHHQRLRGSAQPSMRPRRFGRGERSIR